MESRIQTIEIVDCGENDVDQDCNSSSFLQAPSDSGATRDLKLVPSAFPQMI